MGTSWKSQQGNGKYCLQFETSDREKYKLVERASQMAIDGKTLEDLTPKSNWISVNERLPEREGKYLVFTTRGTVLIGSYFSYYSTGDPTFDYWVTHWMPIPHPPNA